MQELVKFCRSVDSKLGDLQDSEWTGLFTVHVDLNNGNLVSGACETSRTLILSRDEDPKFRSVFDSLGAEFASTVKKEPKYFGRISMKTQVLEGIVVDICFDKRQTFSLRT